MSAGFERKKFSANKISSLFFMSPDRILAEVDLNNEAMLAKCDTWSVGVILYFLFFGDYPFTGDTRSKLVKEIRKGKLSTKINQKRWSTDVILFYDFLQKLIEKDPAKRLDAE